MNPGDNLGGFDRQYTKMYSHPTLAVFAGLLSLLAVGCASHDEVARAQSPDGALDAVVVESNGGATTSFWYNVYVVEAGAPYSSEKSVVYLYGAGRSASAYGVNLKWQSPTELNIEFLDARETKINLPMVRVAGRDIQVALRAGINDPSAPPGGMLYNLQGRPHDRS